MSKVSVTAVQRPARGETVCGDGYTVVTAGLTTIIGVADGLGHGPGAAEASERFCEYIEQHPTAGLEGLLTGAHDHMVKTRGAAAAIIELDEAADTMGFVGVGNIELSAVSGQPIKPVCTPGVLGGHMRKYRRFDYAVERGDLMAIYSDGISRRFDLRRYQHLDADEMAELILAEHGKHHDDATCVIVRYG